MRGAQSRAVALVALVLLPLAPAGPAWAEVDVNGEIRAITRIAADLKPLPADPGGLGVLAAMRGAMRDLREPIEQLAGPRGEVFDVCGRFLILPAPLSQIMAAQGRLHNALADDIAALGDAISTYRLPTYVDPGGTPLPPAVQMRYDLADLTHCKFYLNRLQLLELKAMFDQPSRDPSARRFWSERGRVIAPRGLRGLLAGSERARTFVATIIGRYEDALRNWDQEVIALVDDLTPVTAETMVPALRARLEEIDRRGRHVFNTLQFTLRTLHEIVPLMAQIASQPIQGADDLSARMDALGHGLARSLGRAREVLPKVSRHHSTMSATDRIVLDGPEVLLARIEDDMHLLFSGGGWHITNYSLGEDERGPGGEAGLAFYQQALIFRYVMVVAAEVSRLRPPSLGRRLLAHAGVHRPRPQLPPTRTDEVESRLWTRFFRAAGLDERRVCAGYLTAPTAESDEDPTIPRH